MNITMAISSNRFISMSTILLIGLVAASPAHAFRCGNKIVIENMHEQQVLRACGEPTTVRHLGYVARSYELIERHRLSPGVSKAYYPAFGRYTQEVVITEYVYNFGPRKFMRRLIFEGGVLVSIESIGYGYHDSGD